MYVFNTQRQTGSWRTEIKPQEEWGRVECPPIVSEDVWDQANKIMAEQLKGWKRPGKPPVHLFSGLAHCSCGGKMYVSNKTPKYFCRKCRNKVGISDLENFMREELNLFFGKPERVAGHLEAAKTQLAEKSALLDTHRREVQKVADQMQMTQHLYFNRQISGDGFRDIYGPAEERKRQLDKELARLEAEVGALKVNRLSADDVLRESHTMYERWPKLPAADKRQVVETLIERIEIGDGKIRVSYSCTPTSSELCKNQRELGFR